MLLISTGFTGTCHMTDFLHTQPRLFVRVPVAAADSEAGCVGKWDRLSGRVALAVDTVNPVPFKPVALSDQKLARHG